MQQRRLAQNGLPQCQSPGAMIDAPSREPSAAMISSAMPAVTWPAGEKLVLMQRVVAREGLLADGPQRFP
jgi:hypothetical protein